ncbi:MAG: DNRLRE domain-containing protein [Candidatus Eisenbacteria bacterium]
MTDPGKTITEDAPAAMRCAGRRVAVAAAAFTLFMSTQFFACTETHEPLDWRTAVRGGLESPDTLISDTLIVESAQGPANVSTGISPYLLTGRIVRSGQEITADLFLRWDVTDLTAAVERVNLVMHLAAVDLPDTMATRIFPVEMYAVESAWSEDSLFIDDLPTVGTLAIAASQVDVSALAGDSVVTLGSVFSSPAGSDFAQLVEAWRSGTRENFGVMVRAAIEAPEGVLRFFSAEGLPSGFSTLESPLLFVETVDDSLLNIEADDDAFVIRPLTGPAAELPDSLTLVSAGYIHRTALRFDVTPLLGADGDPRLDIAIVQGLLRLHVAAAEPWSLDADQSFLVSVYPAAVDWSQLDPVRTAVLGDRLAQVTVSGDDEFVEIGIAPFLQGLIEGGSSSLVLLAGTELLEAKYVLFKDLQAEAGRPEVTLTYARLGGRLDE